MKMSKLTGSETIEKLNQFIACYSQLNKFYYLLMFCRVNPFFGKYVKIDPSI